jgi:RHS repeat-associated protein
MVDYGANNRVRFRYVGLTTSVAQTIDDASGLVLRNVGTNWTGERLLDWTGTNANIRYYGTNAHHDTVWTGSSTGTVSATLRYDPFGTLTNSTGSLPDFRYQGSWYDATTSLSWVVTRWYAPALGRFLSEDSLLGEPNDPPSRHLYAYSAGEPIARWDPDGRYWYRVKHGDTLHSVAQRFLGGEKFYSAIVKANRGRIAQRRSTIYAGQCIWIPKPLSELRAVEYWYNQRCAPETISQMREGTAPPSEYQGYRRGYSAGFCVAVVGGVGGYATATGCLVEDDTGRRAFLITAGAGGVTGASAFGGVGYQLANGRIDALKGWFGSSGGSWTFNHIGPLIHLPVAPTVGAEFFYGNYGKGHVVGVQFMGGLSLRLPFLSGEFHSAATYTWIVSENKAFFDRSQFIPVWVSLRVLLFFQGQVPAYSGGGSGGAF